MTSAPLDLLPDPRIERLQAENAELRERLLQFEKDFLGSTLVLPRDWKLTRTEGRLFCVLLSRDMVTRNHAMTALYHDRDVARDEPEQKILDVLISKIRGKMNPLGLVIETIWGQGWRIPEPCRTDFLHRIKPWTPELARRPA